MSDSERLGKAVEAVDAKIAELESDLDGLIDEQKEAQETLERVAREYDPKKQAYDQLIDEFRRVYYDYVEVYNAELQDEGSPYDVDLNSEIGEEMAG